RLAAAVAIATIAVGLVGTGVAHADVTFAVSPASSLTDGDLVQISMTGINAIPLATVEISECGNAYGDNTPLPVLTPSTDCKALATVDVSNAPPTFITNLTVQQTQIGLGNRSCIIAGLFSCDLR